MPVAEVPGSFGVCLENSVVKYDLDNHGFRNPDSIWAEDHWQVAILGDSFGAGICVKADQTIAAHLRSVWPLTANVSVSWTSPVDQYAIFREYVVDHKPSVVVWLLYEGNDFRQIEDMGSRFLKYLDDPTYTQNLSARSGELLAMARDENTVPSLLRDWFASLFPKEAGAIREMTLAELVAFAKGRFEEIVTAYTAQRSHATAWYHVRSWAKLSNVRSRLRLTAVQGVDASAISDQTIHLVGRALIATNAAVEGWGGKLVVFFLPEITRFTRARWDRYHSDNWVRLIKDVEGHGIRFIDAGVMLREREPDPTQIYAFGRAGGHFNERGYRAVSDILLEELPSL